MLIINGALPSYRIVAVCDMHTGSKTGLNPIDAPYMPGSHSPLYQSQSELNEFYHHYAREYKHPDLVVIPGDAIDGPGVKSHSIEQFTTDLTIQAEQATRLLEIWEPDDGYRMVPGTGYHCEMYGHPEYTVASNLKAAWNNEDVFSVEGKVFHMKHFVSVGSTEASQVGLVAQETVKMALARESKSYPYADVILRAHAHIYVAVTTSQWLAIALPALQLPGGLFGAKISPRPYNVGLTIIDVFGNGDIHWDCKLLDLKFAAPDVPEYQISRSHHAESKAEYRMTKHKGGCGIS